MVACLHRPSFLDVLQSAVSGAVLRYEPAFSCLVAARLRPHALLRWPGWPCHACNPVLFMPSKDPYHVGGFATCCWCKACMFVICHAAYCVGTSDAPRCVLPPSLRSKMETKHTVLAAVCTHHIALGQVLHEDGCERVDDPGHAVLWLHGEQGHLDCSRTSLTCSFEVVSLTCGRNNGATWGL
jgi:hypothetical protein